MIHQLYDCFKHWSAHGSVYIISDTHFDDSDCKLMDENWISPEEHIRIINQTVHKNDTLIHLGDVGNPKYMNQIKSSYRVLIKGNHDKGSEIYKPYFNEIYSGVLFIGKKILLSHEPVWNNYHVYSFEEMKTLHDNTFFVNIHGHNHGDYNKWFGYVNLAANVYNFQVFNLGKEIKNGLLKDVKSIHRLTIDDAIQRKQRKEYVLRTP